MSTKIITVLNEKGGCGKTTTVIQTSYFLAQSSKVLLIDIDKQASSTIHLTGRADHKRSSYDLFKSEGDLLLNKTVVKLEQCWGNLLLVPADRRLTNIEQELSSTIDRDRILKRILDETNNYFDYIIIDTPPVLGLETRNALIASTHYIMVTDMSEYSEIGVQNARLFADKIKSRANKKLTEIGVLLTGFEKENAKIVKDVIESWKQDKNFLTEWIIPHSVKVLEAQKQNRALGDIYPSSLVAKRYNNFVNYIKENIQ